MELTQTNNANKTEMDQKEEECLRTVYKMMEGNKIYAWSEKYIDICIKHNTTIRKFVDDFALKPMRKHYTDSFMLMSIRSYQYDVMSVFRVVLMSIA